MCVSSRHIFTCGLTFADTVDIMFGFLDAAVSYGLTDS